MADLASERAIIQVEETQFRAAVSEATAQRMGGALNLLQDYQYGPYHWELNGLYANVVIAAVNTMVDGFRYVDRDSTITQVFMYTKNIGSGGTTTTNIQYSTDGGTNWTSIFTTKPAISSSAISPAPGANCFIGSSNTGTTAPVLSVTSLDAGTILRWNIDAVMTGTPVGVGINLFLQPR